MRITLEINPSDVEVIAEYMLATRTGECTSQQHAGIVNQTLTRIVVQAWTHHQKGGDAGHELVARAMADNLKAVAGRGLPRVRRLGGPGHRQ